MTDDRRQEAEPQGILATLLSALRAPRHVIDDVAAITAAVLALQRDARQRLASIDDSAGELLQAIGTLQAPLDRIDRKVTELQRLEQAVTERMDAIQDDLNARMLAIEAEVRAMRSPLEAVSRDVSQVVRLLPEPGDGPFARLKDTLTSS